MERDPEPAADQFGDAAGRPQVGREPVGGRLLGQPLADLLILFGGQKPGPARRGLGGQTWIARGSVSGHPLGHGDTVDAQSDGHSRLGPSGENHLDRPTPHGFQIGSRSFASHGEDVT